MKTRRLLFFSFLIVALLVCGCGLWARQAQRQYAPNRQLIAALVHNDSKQALAIVNNGADPNTRYNPPPAPTLELLLNQLLHQSSRSEEDSPTAFLLACGADGKLIEGGIRGQKHRPDNLELVRAMLPHEAIQHPHTEGDYIALHCAAMYNRVRVAELLINQGADVNEQDKVGLTPLMGAVWLKHREMESLLLKHGADVNLADKTGETPLHFAINPDSDVEIIRQLLAHGADPTRVDDDGETTFAKPQDINAPTLWHCYAKAQSRTRAKAEEGGAGMEPKTGKRIVSRNDSIRLPTRTLEMTILLLLLHLPANFNANASGNSRKMGEAARSKGAAHVPLASPAAQAVFTRDVRPFVQKYCLGCHSGANAQSGINLALYKDVAGVLKAGSLWERVAQNVASGNMPPSGSSAPAQPQRDQFTAWIQTTLSAAACALHDPGHVTLRRLNRAEYNNTVRDLCGVDIHPADAFPSDDVGYGFDNIGDVLSLSPLLMEKYISAAQKVAHAAFLNPDDFLSPTAFGPADLAYIHEADRQNGTDGDHASLYATNSEAGADYQFPQDGDYLLRAIAWQDRAGKEPAQMQLKLDGKALVTVPVVNEGRDHRPYTVRMRVPAGQHRFSAVFLNDFYDGSEVNYDKSHHDRNLNLQALEIVGPLHPQGFQSPLTTQLGNLEPAEARRTGIAHKFLSDFARRAYRRPVTNAEVTKLMRFVERAQEQGETFQQGIENAMTAALCSPYFLFHLEVYAPTPASTSPQPKGSANRKKD